MYSYTYKLTILIRQHHTNVILRNNPIWLAEHSSEFVMIFCFLCFIIFSIISLVNRRYVYIYIYILFSQLSLCFHLSVNASWFEWVIESFSESIRSNTLIHSVTQISLCVALSRFTSTKFFCFWLSLELFSHNNTITEIVTANTVSKMWVT